MYQVDATARAPEGLTLNNPAQAWVATEGSNPTIVRVRNRREQPHDSASARPKGAIPFKAQCGVGQNMHDSVSERRALKLLKD